MTYDLLSTIASDLFTPYMLGLAFIGVVLGLLFGALPGVSSTMALAVMLPFTYGMETAPAMVLMLAVFFSSVYAGSVSAILLNIPGTPGAMITLLDGNAMAREGKAAEAMAYALIASIFGGIIGWVLLVLLAPTIAGYALQFGSPEYAAVVLFGLALVAYASSGDMLRGLAAGAIGLIIGVVGRDQVTDVPRFTFGTVDLQGGIDIIPPTSLKLVRARGPNGPRCAAKSQPRCEAQSSAHLLALFPRLAPLLQWRLPMHAKNAFLKHLKNLELAFRAVSLPQKPPITPVSAVR